MEGISEEWVKKLYDDFPLPLPLHRFELKEESLEFKEEVLDRNRSEKVPQKKRCVTEHKFMRKFDKEKVNRPVYYNEERKKLVSELLSEKKKMNMRSVYCSCKSEPDSYKAFKRAVGACLEEIPIVYNNPVDWYLESLVEEGFKCLYVKERPRSFRDLVCGYLDPNLPVYHEEEPRNIGICELHRNPTRNRCKMRKISKELSEFVFDSEFESGNLEKVVENPEGSFDLFLAADTNTQGHTEWFYFSVENLSKKEASFNIMNFTKNGSLYSKGMRPMVFSIKLFEEKGTGWHREGYEIKYFKNNIKRETGYHYTLSFKYFFQYEFDTVYFAYSEPYTYTELVGYLENLKQNLTRDFVYEETELCSSLGGLSVPLVKIMNKEKSAPLVGVTARVHPGETVGSIMLEGFLSFLTGQSNEAKLARKTCSFLIIPMLNPDGVVTGNYRTSIAGVDLNRRWKNPSLEIFPTVTHAKELMKSVHFFIDFHGHSKKEFAFMYGNAVARKEEKYWKMRVLPLLLSKLTENFSYENTKFMAQDYHSTTARAVLSREFGVQNSFTLEASFFGYNFGETHKEFNRSDYEEIGRKLVPAIWGITNIPIKNITNFQSLTQQVEAIRLKLTCQNRKKPFKRFSVSVYCRNNPFVKKKRALSTSAYVVEEEKEVEELSEGSDSDPSEDNLDPLELLAIHSEFKTHKKNLSSTECSIVKHYEAPREVKSHLSVYTKLKRFPSPLGGRTSAFSKSIPPISAKKHRVAGLPIFINAR